MYIYLFGIIFSVIFAIVSFLWAGDLKTNILWGVIGYITGLQTETLSLLKKRNEDTKLIRKNNHSVYLEKSSVATALIKNGKLSWIVR